MSRAEREGRVLVTKDKDFGELAFKGGQAHAGVILLRRAWNFFDPLIVN